MTEEKKKVLNRLRHIEDQIRGVQKMIDEERKCIDVTTQLDATRSSIDHVMGVIVAENLKHCPENLEKDPEEQEEQLVQAINVIIRK